MAHARLARRVAATAVSALAGLVALGALASSPSPPAAAAPAHDKLLVALGDSLAAGYQPTDHHHPPPVDPTTGLPDGGYPGSYAADLAKAEHLRLVDLGCPGETSASFTASPAQGACRRAYERIDGTTSQLGAALAYLAAHRGQVALVTFDLGGNDVEACYRHGSLDGPCLARVPATLAARLPSLITTVRAALAADDPGAPMAAMTYYDPLLGLAYRPGGWRGDALAALSLGGLEAVDSTLSALYHHEHLLVAHVAAAFASGSVLPLSTYRGAHLPHDAAVVCRLTYMCPARHGRQPNVHPNARGYAAIARAFERALGTRVAPRSSTAS